MHSFLGKPLHLTNPRFDPRLLMPYSLLPEMTVAHVHNTPLLPIFGTYLSKENNTFFIFISAIGIRKGRYGLEIGSLAEWIRNPSGRVCKVCSLMVRWHEAESEIL